MTKALLWNFSFKWLFVSEMFNVNVYYFLYIQYGVSSLSCLKNWTRTKGLHRCRLCMWEMVLNGRQTQEADWVGFPWWTALRGRTRVRADLLRGIYQTCLQDVRQGKSATAVCTQEKQRIQYLLGPQDQMHCGCSATRRLNNRHRSSLESRWCESVWRLKKLHSDVHSW